MPRLSWGLRMFGKYLSLAERGFMLASAIAFTLMMLLVSADALVRYAFAQSIGFQFELTQNYLMVAGCMLGLSWAKTKGAFIHISGVGKFLGRRGRMTLHGLNHSVAAALFYAVFYLSLQHAVSSFKDGDVIFGYIDWPVWASEIWVPLGVFLLATRFLNDGVRLLLGFEVEGLSSSSEEE